MFEIEKNVAIPNGRTGPKLGKFPLAKMEVGDSFLIPFKNSLIRGQHKQVPSVGINIAAANRTFGPKKFRKAREDKGVRVFRVE